jgi:hypothetical protein
MQQPNRVKPILRASNSCCVNSVSRSRASPGPQGRVPADWENHLNVAIPANLPAQIRDDVIGAMALELVEGKLKTTDVRRRVREFIKAQFRQFGKFGPLSLDARLFEDGNATLLDRLSTEAGTGYWDINMMASTGRRK